MFSRFFVMDMSRFNSPAIPPTFPAFESIAPKNLNPLSVLRMRPTRICVVKFHRQKNKKSPRAQRLLYSWALGLYWSDIQFKAPAAPGTHHRQRRNAGSSDRLKQELLTSRTAHLVTRNDSRARIGHWSFSCCHYTTAQFILQIFFDFSSAPFQKITPPTEIKR